MPVTGKVRCMAKAAGFFCTESKFKIEFSSFVPLKHHDLVTCHVTHQKYSSIQESWCSATGSQFDTSNIKMFSSLGYKVVGMGKELKVIDSTKGQTLYKC